MKNLKQALAEVGVKAKDTVNSGEFAIQCPFCDDHLSRLQINEAKGVYYCYHRGCRGHLSKIIQHFKIDFKIDFETQISPVHELREKLNTVFLNSKEDNALSLVSLDISKYAPILESDSWVAKKALQYLLKRGFSEAQIAAYDLRFASTGEYGRRVIIPFYENKQVVYYQARAFTTSKKKVLNPLKKEALLGVSNWLFGFDFAKKYNEVIICEGSFSAMSVGYNAVALSGLTMSTVQMFKLINNWKSFIVMMDAGMIKPALEIAQKLKFFAPSSTVFIVELPYGDPNDVTRDELLFSVENNREFKSIPEWYRGEKNEEKFEKQIL